MSQHIEGLKYPIVMGLQMGKKLLRPVYHSLLVK